MQCVYMFSQFIFSEFAAQTHGVLLQYLELLTSPSVVSPQDYANKVIPSVAELAERYGLCAPICMQIIRPVLHTSLLASMSFLLSCVSDHHSSLPHWRCKSRNELLTRKLRNV